MEHQSDYAGPTPDDYANVLALNTAYLKVTSDMKGPQRGRLAKTPFLLFSFRESDLDWWQEALSEIRQGQLLAVAQISNPELRHLQTAGLSFLWQLARRNPYAARIISGATISWCEIVGELPLVVVLDRIAARGDLMLSRLDGSDQSALRLLGDGTSSQGTVRRSFQVSALQALLTANRADNYSRLPAAACSMSGPLRVLDKKL